MNSEHRTESAQLRIDADRDQIKVEIYFVSKTTRTQDTIVWRKYAPLQVKLYYIADGLCYHTLPVRRMIAKSNTAQQNVTQCKESAVIIAKKVAVYLERRFVVGGRSGLTPVVLARLRRISRFG